MANEKYLKANVIFLLNELPITNYAKEDINKLEQYLPEKCSEKLTIILALALHLLLP